MRKIVALLGFLTLAGCVGHDTPEALKAEAYHQQLLVKGNYQDVFRCYREREYARGMLIDGEIYSDSDLAVLDYLLQLGTFGYTPGANGWYARGEVRKYDDTLTQVDVWHGYQGGLDEMVNSVNSCAQT